MPTETELFLPSSALSALAILHCDPQTRRCYIRIDPELPMNIWFDTVVESLTFPGSTYMGSYGFSLDTIGLDIEIFPVLVKMMQIDLGEAEAQRAKAEKGI